RWSPESVNRLCLRSKRRIITLPTAPTRGGAWIARSAIDRFWPAMLLSPSCRIGESESVRKFHVGGAFWSAGRRRLARSRFLVLSGLLPPRAPPRTLGIPRRLPAALSGRGLLQRRLSLRIHALQPSRGRPRRWVPGARQFHRANHSRPRRPT